MECPGCGMQRSFICLLRGEWQQSLVLHPATIPMVALLVFTVIHLVFKVKHGARIIVALQLTVGVLTMLFYIYKLTNQYNR